MLLSFPVSGISVIDGHGDSITYGYGLPNLDTSFLTDGAYPSVLQGLFYYSKFDKLGANLCPDPNLADVSKWAKSAGVSLANNLMTHTANASDLNPRAVTNTVQSIDPTKAIIIEADIDASNWNQAASGYYGYGLRIDFSTDNGSTFLPEQRLMWTTKHTGYRRRRFIILPSEIPTGANSAKTGTYCVKASGDPDSTAVFKNFNFYQTDTVVKTFNTGVSGNTSADGLARFDTDVAPKKPTHVVLMFGTNDVRNGIDINTWLSNMKAMVDKARAIGAQPIIMTMPPMTSSQTNYTLVPTWNTQLKTNAQAWGVPIVDNYTEFIKVGGANGVAEIADGRHPTAYGYGSLIARNVFMVLTGKREG